MHIWSSFWTSSVLLRTSCQVEFTNSDCNNTFVQIYKQQYTILGPNASLIGVQKTAVSLILSITISRYACHKKHQTASISLSLTRSWTTCTSFLWLHVCWPTSVRLDPSTIISNLLPLAPLSCLLAINITCLLPFGEIKLNIYYKQPTKKTTAKARQKWWEEQCHEIEELDNKRRIISTLVCRLTAHQHYLGY